jgi:outer membrane biosynthesis protein TonB
MPTVSQSVTVESQKKGTNWVGIVIGVFVVMALCIGAVLIYRTYSENQPADPIEPPPPVEQPTNEPMPTQPPIEQPTTPPEEPPAQLPEDQPDSPPQEPPGTDLPICNSIGLIGVPLVVIGVSRLRKKRR